MGERVAWNKGRKETREDVLLRQSKSHLGIKNNSKTKFKAGMIPWNKGVNFGKKDFEETLRSNGYVYIKFENNWILKHRWIMEKHIGRKLTRKEAVHHIDENKENNEIENLKLISFSEHIRIHKPGRWGLTLV